MKCSDPLLTYLKGLGYNTVLIPRADIHPLQIAEKDGNYLNQCGPLSDIFIASDSAPLPPINQDIAAASKVSGRRTGALKIGFGLDLMQNIFTAMGLTSLDILTKYEQADTLAYTFHDVTSDAIDTTRLDLFLGAARINRKSQHYRKLIYSDEAYVIVRTIKSKKFSVEAKKSDKTGLELSVPEIKGLVGGKINVSGQTTNSTNISYEGRTPLVFGFQAVQLVYENGKFQQWKWTSPGSAGMRGETESATEPDLQTIPITGSFIHLNW